MPSQKTFFPRQVVEAGGNRWDWALLPLVLAVIVLMAFGARQMATPYQIGTCLLYTSPSPRDRQKSRMPSSA